MNLVVSALEDYSYTQSRFANANIGIEEGVHESGLWGCDDLVDSIRKHDQACERINERDGVKIKRAIVCKDNLPKQKPPKIKELVVPQVQSTHALTYDRKTDKV